MGTTLTVGPMKNAERINRIGEAAAGRFGLRWLPADFKKEGGVLRSIELSGRFGLYRQDFCGCSFSRRRGPDAGPGFPEGHGRMERSL